MESLAKNVASLSELHNTATSIPSAVLSGPLRSGSRPVKGILTEWLLRFVAVFVYGVAVSNIVRALRMDPTRWTLIALLVTEGYALVLIVCARRSSLRDTSTVALVATLYSVFYYVFFDPGRTTALISEFAGMVFYIVGTAWQFSAKASLGRSFGLLPAQRGMVASGPYRIARHPMYLGYVIGQTGFVLVNFSLQNLLILLGIYMALWLRISREEAVLATSADYRAYQERVRWRLLPHVF
jgi:protein-S-isoprenylcysteine O-methyltransferase Ste14